MPRLLIERASIAERAFVVAGVLAFCSSALLIGAPGMRLADLTVGKNLEVATAVELFEPAPPEGVSVAVRSSDPARVLLSLRPDVAGSDLIVVTVPPGVSRSQQFFVQGLAQNSAATYTASAPGYVETNGTLTLAASGVVLRGPGGLGSPLMTTPHGAPLTITVGSVVLTPDGGLVAPQLVAGGYSLAVEVATSDANIGRVIASPVTIPGGSASATAQFQAVSSGTTTLNTTVPEGFTLARQYGSLTATVITPGIGLFDVSIGRDLQAGASLTLGEPAPDGGLEMQLKSNDPSKLLLSATANSPGSPSIMIKVPPKGSSGSFFLQSLSDEGTATYMATAPGYQSRTGTVTLAPSGLVIGIGPPDEAELFRKEAADEAHGFLATLSSHNTLPIGVYLVQLDPKTHRGADITVQALRPGLSVTVDLKSSDSTVGSIASPVTITGGSSKAVAPFSPLHEGETMVSVVTPEGFTPAYNSTLLKAIVKQ